MKNLKSYLYETGLSPGQHVLVHSAFRSIRSAFPGVDIGGVIQTIKDIITSDGSLIMPGFSYCFKKYDDLHEIFIKGHTKSKVGAVSDTFRQMADTTRTSSPTHSFLLWGKINTLIPQANNPISPLGKGSVLEWMDKNENTMILLLGTDFSSLTFGHYLESAAELPWLEYSPWNHLLVEPTGVSESGMIELKDVPGCSKSFKIFQYYLEENGVLHFCSYNGLKSTLIPVRILVQYGLPYFRSNPEKLLCTMGTCTPCDARWAYYLKKINSI